MPRRPGRIWIIKYPTGSLPETLQTGCPLSPPSGQAPIAAVSTRNRTHTHRPAVTKKVSTAADWINCFMSVVFPTCHGPASTWINLNNYLSLKKHIGIFWQKTRTFPAHSFIKTSRAWANNPGDSACGKSLKWKMGWNEPKFKSTLLEIVPALMSLCSQPPIFLSSDSSKNYRACFRRYI